jgi:hypothetical protein
MSAMVRSISIAILIVTAGAFAVVLLCVLTLRFLLSALFKLSGIRRRWVRGGEVLNW